MHPQVKSVVVAGCLLAASILGAAAFEAVTIEPSELREGAAWEFAPIVQLPPGSIVEVLNCDRSWCEVGIEDYDGFLPRGVLDLGGSSVPLYAFPPQVAAPALWHGRYYSRDHFRHESRARWRDRDNRRLYVLPPRAQPRPLRPIDPNERRGQKQFDQKGPATDQRGKKHFDQKGPTTDQRGKKQFDQKGSTTDQRGKKQFDQKGPTTDQRGKKHFDQKGPTTDQPRIQRGPDQPRIQRGPDQPRTMKQEPRPQIQQQVPVQRQAPPQKQPEKKKQDQKG